MTSFEKQGSTINHASFEDRMRENQNNQQPSRIGLSRRSTRDVEGEIVEVEGGHIVRSIGRKDRHSKVCTAKGPRDRRVRLSAHTAIQFYDVQDRLGYDRPSKAVDWLIKKAKTAIDNLAELPPWQPNSIVPTQEDNRQFIEGGPIDQPMVDEPPIDSGFGFFPPLDSDSIADTIQSFFPMSASASASTSSSSSSLHFQNYPPDLLSRTSSSQIQDLRLSLQSFQDPSLHQPSSSAQQTLFSTSASPAFDAISMNWSDQQQQLPEMWRSMDVCVGGGGEFVFNSPALQPMFGQNPFFSQRGPLQSSNSPHVRAWIDSPIDTIDHHQTYTMHPSSISCIGFSGFRIPARIQSEEEHNDGFSNKPSSASSH